MFGDNYVAEYRWIAEVSINGSYETEKFISRWGDCTEHRRNSFIRDVQKPKRKNIVILNVRTEERERK